MSLLDDLISYWPLDEASGTRADVHGSNDLTDNNTVGSNTGVITNAAEFVDGNSESLSHADNAELSVGDIDFSLSAWVWFDILNGTRYIITKDYVFPTYALYYFNNSGEDLLRFTAYFQNEVGITGVVTTDTWLHVYMENDAGNNTVGISVNNGTLQEAAHGGFTNIDDDEALVFGAGSGSFWGGRVCEVGFWKRLLTTDERTELYNGGAGLAYPFAGGGPSGNPWYAYAQQ